MDAHGKLVLHALADGCRVSAVRREVVLTDRGCAGDQTCAAFSTRLVTVNNIGQYFKISMRQLKQRLNSVDVVNSLRDTCCFSQYRL